MFYKEPINIYKAIRFDWDKEEPEEILIEPNWEEIERS